MQMKRLIQILCTSLCFGSAAAFFKLLAWGTDWLGIIFDSPTPLSLRSRRLDAAQWQRSAAAYRGASKAAGRQATQTRALADPADPIFQRSGGKHGDGINHLESEILSWSMEPSTGKFTVATSAPVVCNVAALSSANWHFSLHKSPQKKETPSSSTLWGLSKSQSKWPGCSH